jgi:uncharacterized protein (TIGR02757 family)
MQITYEKLEALYAKYNKSYYIHPDPLEFVYNYQYDHDREIVGLLSSSLAYGNVKQILKSVSIVLGKMGESPRNYILTNHEEVFFKDFEGFKHRFTTCEDFVKLLMGIKSALKKHDSLQKCFVNCLSGSNNILTSNFIKTVSFFAKRLNAYYKDNRSYLIPSPQNGSACKRLMLYLRWMIRKDKVDPGCWNDEILSSKLIIPLDTHMYQISKAFGYTERKSADLKTAIEITENFAAINSVDPVKYDFVLTRFGIRDELNYNDIHS